MKTSILVITVLALAFVSCDRRGSSKELLEKSVSKFNDKQTGIEVTTFYPETYSEVKTDSIIANTFKVHIKNYTLMDAQVMMRSHKKNKIKNTQYHRVFESEINVQIASRTLLKTVINAERFAVSQEPEFWNNATLEHVWVNQEASNETELHLGVSFINPKSKAYKLYEMVITSEGKHDYFLIEQHS